MRQLQLVDVEVDELVQGMYIANLDRPWLGSPFMLEGFLLQAVEDLEKLRELCHHVTVDITRSDDACRPQLLARAAPAAADSTEPSKAVIRRATATLVQEVRSEPGRGPAEPATSLLDDLFAIARESVRGGPRGPDGKAVEGDSRGTATAWRDDAGERRPRIEAAAAWRRAGAAGEPGSAADWSSAGAERHEWNGTDRRLRPRRPEAAVALDPDADSEQLGGSSLIVPQQRQFRAAPQLLEAHRLRDRTFALIGEFLADARNNAVLDIGKAETVIAEMADSLQENQESLRMLSNLKSKDDYSFVHAFDCAVHMMGFSQHLGYGRDTKQVLGLAGLVLDIGKDKLPEDILRHKGRLTPAQFKIAREHVKYSIDSVMTNPKVSPKVLEIVAQHHERIDGSGYPYGLKNKEVGQLAAIAGIVDTYTALTSRRPHEPAMSFHTALTMLQHHAGRLFNEGLVEQFIQYVGLYPVGTLVELNTGEVGLVVRQNRTRRLKPTVMVVLDHDKKPMSFPQMIQLMHDPPAFPDQTPYSIVRDLESDAFPDLDFSDFYLDRQPG